MSSNSIYTHVPYFYIIQHTPSGKYYAGSRWSSSPTKYSVNGCHPQEFMKLGGYTTSSEKVNNLIKLDGIGSFKIVSIMTEKNCLMSVFDYETVFLQANDISSNPQWINRHDNGIYTGLLYGTDEHKKYMLDKHGFSVAAKSPIFLQKMQNTCFEKYGKINPFQVEEFKIKSKSSMLEKYGHEYATQSQEIKNNTKATCLEKYGVLNYSKTSDFRELASELHADSSYWHDSSKNFKLKKGELPESHWIRGVLREKAKGYKWYTNGIKEIQLIPSNNIPKGFVLGKLKGGKIYSDGIGYKRFYSDDIIPEEWSQKGVSHKKIECPHCKLIGSGGNMKRYHFDNCKKNI